MLKVTVSQKANAPIQADTEYLMYHHLLWTNSEAQGWISFSSKGKRMAMSYTNSVHYLNRLVVVWIIGGHRTLLLTCVVLLQTAQISKAPPTRVQKAGIQKITKHIYTNQIHNKIDFCKSFLRCTCVDKKYLKIFP